MKKPEFKGAAWDSMFLAFVRVVSMLVAILQTKILSVGFTLSEYGTYSQANIIISIVSSVIALGLADALNYFYNNASAAKTKEERISFVNTIFSVELVAGLIIGTVVVFGRELIVGYFSNTALRGLMLFVAFKPIVDNALTLYHTLYISTGKAKIIAIRNLVISVAKLAIIYFAVFHFKSISLIYILLIGLEIAQLLLFRIYFAKTEFHVSPLRGSFVKVKTILSYSLPMGIYALTNTLSRDIDKLIISYVADTEQVAIYANCSKLLPLDIVSVAFATVLIPYIMKCVSTKDKKQSVKLFSTYLKVGYYSVWVLGTAVLIVAQTAICFLYSTAYLPGKPIFIIYVIDSMLRFASMHLILTSDGKTKTLLLYSALSLAANAVLNILLYHVMGVVGPAVATLIVSLVYTGAILIKSANIINASWRELFDIRDIAMFLVQLLITGVFFCIAHGLLQGLGVNQYISMIISAGMFIVTNLVLLRNRARKVLAIINSLK